MIIEGIAYVGAVRAKLPVYIYDRSSEQIKKSLALMDKLLSKEVTKGNIQSTEAKEARDRVTIVGEEGVKGFRDLDMVVEVCFTIHETSVGSNERTLRILMRKGCIRECRTKTLLVQIACTGNEARRHSSF
jgi:uncharacterized NAD(P)/FAD-binding protein YdhS